MGGIAQDAGLSVEEFRKLLWGRNWPSNDEMQRTKHGQHGASPLISVFYGPDAQTRMPFWVRDGEYPGRRFVA